VDVKAGTLFVWRFSQYSSPAIHLVIEKHGEKTWTTTMIGARFVMFDDVCIPSQKEWEERWKILVQ